MAEETKQEAAPAPAAPSGDKVPFQSRVIATFIDGIIASVAGTILATVLGFVVPASLMGLAMAVQMAAIGGVYLLRDSILGEGQSPGKKIMKYRVVGPDGKPCTQELSIKRNLPLALGYVIGVVVGVVSVIPVIGTIIALASIVVWPLVGLITLAETYFTYSDPQGNRWGDKFAGTTTQKVA